MIPMRKIILALWLVLMAQKIWGQGTKVPLADIRPPVTAQTSLLAIQISPLTNALTWTLVRLDPGTMELDPVTLILKAKSSQIAAPLGRIVFVLTTRGASGDWVATSTDFTPNTQVFYFRNGILNKHPLDPRPVVSAGSVVFTNPPGWTPDDTVTVVALVP